MKNTLKLFMLLMLVAGMSSCDWIKSIGDVEIDTTIESDLNILTDEAELKSTEAHGFNESVTTPVLNEDLEEYGDLIEDYDVQDITITVVSVDSAGTAISGVEILTGSEFRMYSMSNPGVTVELDSPWPIEPGFSVSLDETAYPVIEELLDAGDPITFSANGTCNNGNIHIVLNYGIDVTVTSNPL